MPGPGDAGTRLTDGRTRQMVSKVKNRTVAALVLAAVLVALVSPVGVARAQHSEEVADTSFQCQMAQGLYAYYKGKYDHATDPKDKSFYYGLMNEYAFQIGYYC
jgi:hypothetical protein